MSNPATAGFIKKQFTKDTGYTKSETTNPIQKEEHSGHIKGCLITGIFATKFLTGLKISEKLHIYEKLKEIIIY